MLMACFAANAENHALLGFRSPDFKLVMMHRITMTTITETMERRTMKPATNRIKIITKSDNANARPTPTPRMIFEMVRDGRRVRHKVVEAGIEAKC